MLVSNQAVPTDIEETTKQSFIKMAKSHGFSASNIINSGTCVYDTAEQGLRVDVLDYDVKLQNGDWDYSIGDCDLDKDLPKKGAAMASNLAHMIANKHDLYKGRKYSGPHPEAAIKPVTDYIGGSSSSSGSLSLGRICM